MRRVLLLDDEEHVLAALRRSLRAHLKIDDLFIETYTDAYDALNRVCVCEFDLAIADYRMPRMSGVDFLQALKDVAPNTVRIMLTASTEFQTALAAINEANVFRFLPKPWNLADITGAIAEAFALRDRLLAEQGLAPPALSAQELEALRLEAEEPGLTRVNWGPDGSIIL